MDVSALIVEVITALSGVALAAADGLFSSASGVLNFSVQGVTECNREACPGSQFTHVGAAWANIGYLAHADVLHLLSATEFGHWAPLIYVCAAIGALIGVAMNMPPKGYVWFFLGPSLYSFLVGTTQPVRGVDWVVANRPQDMAEVWRNAEVGMKNLPIAKRDGIAIDRDGPKADYEVAMPLIFLDSLFSNSANFLVDWSGLYNQDGTGDANSNLAAPEGSAEGPWYLLSNLKWGLLENIVGATARNPGVRDALVTFLTSECGDLFKKSVDSGKYIAAAQSRGVDLPRTVMVWSNETPGTDPRPLASYKETLQGLNNTSIPTPRTLLRLFQEPATPGAFGMFAPAYNSITHGGENLPIKNGRGQIVVCSEYLYTLIQAFRHEAGHAYWQLVRSSPNGFTRNEFIRTLFYGWDIRAEEGGPIATPEERTAFVKHLILLHIIRNELLFAPQVTTVDQRFAPSEQNRINADAQVRTMGSKAKFAELYNWAILMPYLQGILLYFVIMAYPFAAMMMVLPGHHKVFFTWISFFAWLKLWDVGFAFVQVLERSVWAMIGNQTSTARIANLIIETARTAGGIAVGSQGASPVSVASATSLKQLTPIPDVCSLREGVLDGDLCFGQNEDQSEAAAMFLFDRMLLLSASADLDLANGYYIYIMAALYMAVPAVTGQLVLGAKAGAASMAGNMFNGVATEAGNAAKVGYQNDATNKVMTNAGSLSQAATEKAYRKASPFGGVDKNGNPQSMAENALNIGNQAMDKDIAASKAGLKKAQLSTGGQLADLTARSFNANVQPSKEFAATAGVGWDAVSGPIKSLFSSGDNSGDGAAAGAGKGGPSTGTAAGTAGSFAYAFANNKVAQSALGAQADAQKRGLGLDYQSNLAKAEQSGLQAYGRAVTAGADYNAQMDVWEAKNAFASHAAAQAGIAGMNAGQLAATQKPTDMVGAAMNGYLNRSTVTGGGSGMWSQGLASNAKSAQSEAQYAGHGFLGEARSAFGERAANKASNQIAGQWAPTQSMAQGASNTLHIAKKDGVKEGEKMLQFVTDSATREAAASSLDGFFKPLPK